MKYKMVWVEYWSEKHKPSDDRIIVRYMEQNDGWYEHEYIYYFLADNDTQAREKANTFLDEHSEALEAFSVLDSNDNVILTEEAAV